MTVPYFQKYIHNLCVYFPYTVRIYTNTNQYLKYLRYKNGPPVSSNNLAKSIPMFFQFFPSNVLISISPQYAVLTILSEYVHAEVFLAVRPNQRSKTVSCHQYAQIKTCRKYYTIDT